jgi:DNA-binding winged helix-turn-helix (wHTH) protein
MIESFCYEFGPFRLDPARRVLRKDGELVPIAAKAFDLLLALIESRDRPISKEELMPKVWPENKAVTDNTFNVTLSNVRKALSETAREPYYIVRTPHGYRFLAEVQKSPADGERVLNEATVPTQDISAKPDSGLGGHWRFALVSGVLYGLLYTIALLVEVAYRFDQYGRGALLRAPMVWLWAGAVAIGSLAADWRLTHDGKRGGLMAALAIALLGTLALVAGAWLYLPPVPITQLDIQAYTAQAAYLKTVIYFLVLQFFFLLLPFHFIVRMQRELSEGRHAATLALLMGSRLSVVPRGVAFIKLWALAALLALIVVVSLFLHHSLMSHLRPAQFMNLFANLILVRLLLYNALGGVGLWWYYQALNELKRECLMMEDASRQFQHQ